MPNFAYTARDRDGVSVQGELEAGSEQLVAEQLLRSGVTPIRIFRSKNSTDTDRPRGLQLGRPKVALEEIVMLARQLRKGAAVAIAPTGSMDGERFFELFRRTLSYERLSGAMRGGGRLLDDAVLVHCFQAFIDLANHFSPLNPDEDPHQSNIPGHGDQQVKGQIGVGRHT